MAAPATLPALLTTLTDSLTSATSSLPSTTNLAPPADGISLLDTKNELLLSYLHHLVFLIILKLRSQSSSPTTPAEEPTPEDAVTKKLVELRIYLEKGVRPLESRLKYQLDKLLLLAAASETSSSSITPLANGTTPKPNPSERRPATSDTSAGASDADHPAPQSTRIPDLAHRPNPSAFARPSKEPKNTRPSAPSSSSDALYRPPRITPTALPTTTGSNPRRKRDDMMKPRKSHLLNEFVREEMDDGPVAEPSIGAGSGLRGRREREREEERRGYEEMRLVRLPEEKKKMKKRGGGEGFGEDLVGGLGGVEFDGLKGKGKRKRERDGGEEKDGRVGQAWEKRVKRGVGRKRR